MNKRDTLSNMSGHLNPGVNISSLRSETFTPGAADMTTKSFSVCLKTFGCQMNKRDSEIVRGLLEDAGYFFTDNEADADIVIANTCSVREHAEHKALSILGQLCRSDRKKRRIFGLIGCVAQHKKKEIFKSLPLLDFICGPADIYKIPQIIAGISHQSPVTIRKVVAVTADRTSRPLDNINPEYRDSKTHAYINITYGCDNFCSYCIVPYVRGAEVSRPVEDIISEIKALVDRGIKEVTLLGQNVNSYLSVGANNYSPLRTDFVGLLEHVNAIEGIKHISFLTSHPKDATIKLFKAMAKLDKVDKHLHLPIQSGSDRILKLMNRGYTAERYKNLIKEYRQIVPGAKITTDVIVGFPTETDDDFNATKKLMEDIRFDSAYIFKYSPRPPAKSASMEDDVDMDNKKKRNNILLDLQKNISKEIPRNGPAIAG